MYKYEFESRYSFDNNFSPDYLRDAGDFLDRSGKHSAGELLRNFADSLENKLPLEQGNVVNRSNYPGTWQVVSIKGDLAWVVDEGQINALVPLDHLTRAK